MTCWTAAPSRGNLYLFSALTLQLAIPQTDRIEWVAESIVSIPNLRCTSRFWDILDHVFDDGMFIGRIPTCSNLYLLPFLFDLMIVSIPMNLRDTKIE